MKAYITLHAGAGAPFRGYVYGRVLSVTFCLPPIPNERKNEIHAPMNTRRIAAHVRKQSLTVILLMYTFLRFLSRSKT